MLEIIALIILSKRIGNIAKGKGLKSGWYVALLVGLWAVGEVAAMVAYGAMGGRSLLGMVLFGFVGAGIGGFAAFAAVKRASSKLDDFDGDELRALGWA